VGLGGLGTEGGEVKAPRAHSTRIKAQPEAVANAYALPPYCLLADTCSGAAGDAIAWGARRVAAVVRKAQRRNASECVEGWILAVAAAIELQVLVQLYRPVGA